MVTYLLFSVSISHYFCVGLCGHRDNAFYLFCLFFHPQCYIWQAYGRFSVNGEDIISKKLGSLVTNNWAEIIKITDILCYPWAVSLLGLYLLKVMARVDKGICTMVFFAVLFVKGKPNHQWINGNIIKGTFK